MKAAAESIWGSDSLSGKTVAMQGFGNVARQTAMHLRQENVRLIVTDINGEAIEEARSLGATIVAPDDIYDVEADIFSPCALGGILNDETIPRLKAALVAGGANNQL
ncbi:MAG: leucine dehydrogenase, partial [Chloroflexi bacterium]|nr:leucine dehydrogenase [Chloroflexota bacterium]